MVRTRGLEPPQDCSHYHLKVARLPIPPRPLGKEPSYLICFAPKTQVFLAAGQMIVDMSQAVVGADHSFEIVYRGAEFNAGIECAVRIEDILDLL